MTLKVLTVISVVLIVVGIWINPIVLKGIVTLLYLESCIRQHRAKRCGG